MVLFPGVEFHCADTIVSVTWVVENPTVASVLERTPVAAPGTLQQYKAVVTGLSLGLTMVSARIAFGDGTEREAAEAVTVVPPPPPPPGSTLIAEGTLDLQPSTNQCVVIAVEEGGRLHVVVDWTSPLSAVNAGLYEGLCDTVGTRVDWMVESAKPLRAEATVVVGEYAMRVISLVSETASYEVRLTPG